MKEKYEMMVQQMGLNKQIHLLGYRDDVLRILPLFDLYYFPSLTEGQPNALIEAMATGLPFVASDIAPIKESVPPAIRSLLLPPCDSERAVKVIERIYKGRVTERSICVKSGRNSILMRMNCSLNLEESYNLNYLWTWFLYRSTFCA